MIETLLLPFTYNYMFNAMWVSALVGGVCAFLSAYLMLKGWSLIGEALSHSILPGVGPAICAGRICCGRIGGWCDAVSQPKIGLERGHYYWADLYVVLWFGIVHGLAVTHICEHPNHYNGQHPCHHTI